MLPAGRWGRYGLEASSGDLFVALGSYWGDGLGESLRALGTCGQVWLGRYWGYGVGEASLFFSREKVQVPLGRGMAELALGREVLGSWRWGGGGKSAFV